MSTRRKVVNTLALMGLFALPGSALAEEPAVETPVPIAIPDCPNLPGLQTTAPSGLTAYWYPDGRQRPVTKEDEAAVADAWARYPERISLSCHVAGAGVEPSPLDTIDLTSIQWVEPFIEMTQDKYQTWVYVFRPNVTVQGTNLRDQISAAAPNKSPYRPLAGSITLYGNGGNDFLAGGTGGNVLDGGLGNDQLAGSPGPDRLIGGPGNDSMSGLAGKDQLIGGKGNDSLDSTDGKPGDIVNCGPGRDKAHIDRGDRVFGCERMLVKKRGKYVAVRGVNPARWTVVP